MDSCEKYLELISEAIDGEISEADRSALEIHLESCPECRKAAEALAAISGNFPRETAAPENFTSGTMAKIRSVAAQPTGFKKFISGYGKYTGLAAAVVVLILGINVFSGSNAFKLKNTAAKPESAADCAPMAVAESDCAAAESESVVYATADSSAGYNSAVSGASGGGALTFSPSVSEEAQESAGEPAPTPLPEAPGAAPAAADGADGSFSVSTAEVTDVNALYAQRGYSQRFYSVSRLFAPAPDELAEFLAGSDSDMLYSDLHEQHYKVPMAQLNELHPEVFTEIVFDDLTSEYGLIILMTQPEETEEK